jgi:cytochrome c oxidase cbb3-type subunit III
MQQRILNWCLFFAGLAALSGCGRLPGKPKEEDRWKPPEANKDFADLYNTNCVACHGNEKGPSASISFNNPVYLSVVPKEVIRKVVAEGVPGTMMPGYSAAVGGLLTDEQINILADGIHNGGAGHPTAESDRPPYAASAGDAQRGAAVYAQNCAGCHGNEGTGGKAGSVVDPAYLSLVSDQYLRTVVIAGRPELGMPGYQEYVSGKPMTAEEIADVVGWLSSHREGPAPGQSTPEAATAASTQTSDSNHQ